jgi:Holliday junction resolvase RusA-like endonuclease
MFQNKRSPVSAKCGAPENDLAGASIYPKNTEPVADLQPPSRSPITITLAGAPQGKGRARAFIRGGHVNHYRPEAARSYEGLIHTAAMQELGDRPPFDEPVEVTLRAVFPVPASWSERKRTQAVAGVIKPGKLPDADNVAMAWLDALNGVVFRDDALIVRLAIEKVYGQSPSVVVTVRRAAQ